MSRKSGVRLALACAPLVAVLFVFSGCDSGQKDATDMDRNPRNELNQSSMDYMRQQYDSKKAAKK